jgi:hypothetical protein
VQVRQHCAVSAQHCVEEEWHRRDHPRHDEAEEDPCVRRPATDILAGMGHDGVMRTSLLHSHLHQLLMIQLLLLKTSPLMRSELDQLLELILSC